MNELFTLQDLAEALAKRQHIDLTYAQTFVRTVFALIREHLLADKYVKVNGLGTFKLIRLSEDGTNIVFTPDAVMRELVNKPFGFFEPVELNDSVHFDDIAETNEAHEEDTNEEVSPANVLSEEPTMKQTHNEAQSSNENSGRLQSSGPASFEEQNKRSECTAVQEQVPAGEVPSRERWHRFPWCMAACVLLAGVLLGVGIAWNLLAGREYIPEQVVALLQKKEYKESCRQSSNPSKVAGVIPTDSFRHTFYPSKVVLPAAAEARDSQTRAEILSDTVIYEFTGTRTVHTLKNGDTLVKLAYRYYGNKQLWPYLVRYNKDIIVDADHVPVGTIIRIPNLLPKNK